MSSFHHVLLTPLRRASVWLTPARSGKRADVALPDHRQLAEARAHRERVETMRAEFSLLRIV